MSRRRGVGGGRERDHGLAAVVSVGSGRHDQRGLGGVGGHCADRVGREGARPRVVLVGVVVVVVVIGSRVLVALLRRTGHGCNIRGGDGASRALGRCKRTAVVNRRGRGPVVVLAARGAHCRVPLAVAALLGVVVEGGERLVSHTRVVAMVGGH